MKTRILSMILCVLMLVSMIPVSVSAVGADTWDGTVDTTWYNDTDTTFILTTAKQLAGLATLVNGGNTFEGKTIKLDADINLNKLNWTPIGQGSSWFMGIFDGQNYTVSNMTINLIDAANNKTVGLFGLVMRATVKNLTVKNSDITVIGKRVRSAAVAGCASSGDQNPGYPTITFENVHVDGCTINATANGDSAYVGGVAGLSYPANQTNITVSNLTLNVKAEGKNAFVAAMVGYQQGQNISNNGNTRQTFAVDTFTLEDIDITAAATSVYAGGYTGYAYYGYRTVKNGTVNGIKMDVDSANAFVGGIFGQLWRGDNLSTVTKVDITGIDFDVTTAYHGETRVGGMVGTSQGTANYSNCSVAGKITEQCTTGEINHHAKVGGFVGRAYTWGMNFTNCVADVDITASHVAGGFIGNHITSASYTNCEAKGDVTANIAGGFAGRLTEHGFSTAVTFDSCEASGAVTGKNVAGGFIGSTADHGWTNWVEGNGTGYAKAVTLKDCVASRTVAGDGLVAGIIGEAKLADGVALTHNNVQFTVYPPYLPTETGKLLPSSVNPTLVDVTPSLSPADAAIEIKNPLGQVESANGGTYSLVEGMTYTYTVTKYDYVTATGSFVAGEPLNVTLTAVHHCAPAAEWSFDANGHWHVCTGGCDELLDYAPHEESDWIVDTDAEVGVEGAQHKECKICGYKPIATEVIPAKEQPLNHVLFALAARYAQRFDVFVSAENATVTGDTTIKYKRTGTVEISVAEGYRLVDVIANGQSLGAVTSVTFKKVMGVQTLVIVTEPIPTEEPVEEAPAA